jgi:hypothetical protein
MLACVAACKGNLFRFFDDFFRWELLGDVPPRPYSKACRGAAVYEELVSLCDGAHRLLVVQDGVTFLDESHQVLSIVVAIGFPTNAVDVLSRSGEDRYGMMAYEHHALTSIYSAAHFILHSLWLTVAAG